MAEQQGLLFKVIQSADEYHETIESGNVIMIFGAEDCKPCQRLKQDVSTDPDAKELLERNAIMARYVDQYSLGTILESVFVFPTIRAYSDGSVIGQVIGYKDMTEILSQVKQWYKLE